MENLRAPSREPEGDAALTELLARVRGPIRQRLAGRGVVGDDLDDLSAETMARLVRAARTRQSSEPTSPIANYLAYALTAADRVFDDYVRRVKPNWCRLKRRVVYLLDGRGGGRLFARWKWRSGWLGGLGRWRGRPPVPTPRYQLFQEDAAPFCEQALQFRNPAQVPLPELLALLFRWLDTPLETDELTSYLAEIQQMQEPDTLALESLEAGGRGELARLRTAEIDDLSRRVLSEIAGESLRQTLWNLIGELPPRQRTALLLGMAREELLLLELAGSVAAILELPPAGFLSLWAILPLSDSAIGGVLNATPKQVSNLRSCARERIARALKKQQEP